MTTTNAAHDIFGGSRPWSAGDWTSSDDRVRGGKSWSSLKCGPGCRVAVFHGDLDIQTLGGAGFASQRTVDPHSWDLSKSEGLWLKVGESDGKKYTLILKDEILPRRPDGREQSTVSWEYDFTCRNSEVFVPWSDLKPTYRGKAHPDAKPLDTANIKRVSIMMRSFFGQQEGPFRMEIERIGLTASVTATSQPPSPSSWLEWIYGVFRW